ncbi:zinc dependent phospholipase C family protein [Mechercharimyces sp. CAU 1602]|uniref:zinc dependent phospholipase C family protein n=1 Tax=Mechercharimyces sp. CAU 1602 TaxID=2973933 RepID=UPI0021611E8E|nr:zinc dependent phospholipase C family protein [Mechercharimyces sp. CAU 1602]MCS1349994.1 zinc dependent phospholipase C family protein [Mechercharimyces sp. CAU 1602]
MPNIWSHIVFAQQCYELTHLPLPQERTLFQLGCQGPDPLFYHHFLPWKKKKGADELGNVMHTQACGPFLVNLLTAAKEEKDIRSYVSGFVTHHLLDRHTHPYIHYKAGYQGYNHQRLEIILDTLIAKQLKGIETWRTPVYKELDVGDDLPATLVHVLNHLGETFYPDQMRNVPQTIWNDAYQDMLKALHLFYDPWGVKTVLTAGKIAPFRYTKNLPAKDYLNESKQSWVHPALPDEQHASSFWDLWENALTEAKEILPLIYTFWEKDGEMAPIRSRLGNLSYDNGKPCSANLTNYLADPIV